MKIDVRRVDAFLRDPGPVIVALFYGEDGGLVRERAGRLITQVAGSRDDPFRVVDVEANGRRLASELASLPLTGGRRVARAVDVGDGITEAVREMLTGNATGLAVLEAGGLPARSKLRTLVEGSARAAAIPCHAEEGRVLEETVRSTLGAEGLSVERDALAWITTQLGGDAATTRRELEKLALFAGPSARIGLATAQACIGDSASATLDDALLGAIEGDVPAAERALERALLEGAAPVQIIRGLISHLQRIHGVRLSVDAGVAVVDAMGRLRPPVFGRRAAAVQRASARWTSVRLERVTASLFALERACKRTGSPDVVLARRATLSVALLAAGRPSASG